MHAIEHLGLVLPVTKGIMGKVSKLQSKLLAK